MNPERLRVLTVIGTRPEAIKMAPVLHDLAQRPEIDSRLCLTGQHRTMLDPVLQLFQLRPDVDLALMRPGQDLYGLTTAVLTALQPVLATERPHLVLVQGDTTTAFAAALSAFYAHIPVAHVEAGLRTGDLAAPFPEEGNRVLISQLAALHFAPTSLARDHLLAAAVDPRRVHVTGNTVIDALFWMRRQLDSLDPASWRELFGAAWPRLLDPAARILLVTGHRRENFGQGFENI
ncbi:MAG: UDP-N-acetylglucosamine 2-epimerase (non-hydrolyzing), partial [Magnetococcus sp. WYHC-3]